MKVKIFCIYDCKTEAFMQPFFMQTKGAALRAWETSVNDSQTQFSKYPADFTLFEIGEYDDETGTVSSHQSKIALGTALEFIKRTPEQGTLFEVNKAVSQ